jgi:Fe-S-cluster-containing dehydrogenase component
MIVPGRAEGFFGAAKLQRTDRIDSPAYISPTEEQHHREILQWMPLAQAAKLKAGEHDELIMPLPEGYQQNRDMYPPHQYKEHRWAMVADLNRCIGCGACTAACYAENNVPIVGKEQVAMSREMAWLRVVPYRNQEDPHKLGWIPLFCQQCDAAPCEPVCPVFASVHNEEGLNAQVYNRCIGTRYCNNNCPYKVRRFNWRDPVWVKPLDMQLNPEVTARSRGVMEKCTFCIQRIKAGEYQAKLENRKVRDGDIRTACQQTCPTDVFSFGDLMDPESAVSKLIRNDPRAYQVLKELNTKPAVIYLKRINEGKG